MAAVVRVSIVYSFLSSRTGFYRWHVNLLLWTFIGAIGSDIFPVFIVLSLNLWAKQFNTCIENTHRNIVLSLENTAGVISFVLVLEVLSWAVTKRNVSGAISVGIIWEAILLVRKAKQLWRSCCPCNMCYYFWAVSVDECFHTSATKTSYSTVIFIWLFLYIYIKKSPTLVAEGWYGWKAFDSANAQSTGTNALLYVSLNWSDSTVLKKYALQQNSHSLTPRQRSHQVIFFLVFLIIYKPNGTIIADELSVTKGLISLLQRPF